MHFFWGLTALFLCFFSALQAKAHSYAISDEFETYEQVVQGLRESGLESSNLIIAFDFTGSNKTQGLSSYCPHFAKHVGGFKYQNLHHLSPEWLNPYQQVIEAITTILAPFDDDQVYPLYEFGSMNSKNHSVTDIKIDGQWPMGTAQVMQCYNDYVSSHNMSGPTSFAPAIDRAVQIVKENRYEYHILLIITDGKVTGKDNLGATYEAIKRATKYPLSIVVVGVGDGPFDDPDEMDDNVQGDFDNLQFVNFTQITAPLYSGIAAPEIYEQFRQHVMCEFAKNAFMEIPQQYSIILERNLMGMARHSSTSANHSRSSRRTVGVSPHGVTPSRRVIRNNDHHSTSIRHAKNTMENRMKKKNKKKKRKFRLF